MHIEGKKIAFIVDAFPAVSETWLINQVADLRDRGIEIEIFSLRPGHSDNISDRYYKYRMAEFTHYLNMPNNILHRLLSVIPKMLRLLIKAPMVLARSLNIVKYGRQATSLQLIFWAEPFVGKKFDLFHCHHGTAAKKFLDIRYSLGSRDKIITSFYGQDVSRIFKAKGDNYYDELKKVSSAFIVMSTFMKERVVAKGFDPSKIHVIPIFGIDVDLYPFKERTIKAGEEFKMVSVGRLVEKKGFDDLLRALTIVKSKANRKITCDIIGGGPLEANLLEMRKDLNLEDTVSFKGFMKIDDVIKHFMNMHLYLQPSKTAPNGDME